MAALVVVGLIVLALVYAVVAYDGLVRLRNRIDNAWSNFTPRKTDEGSRGPVQVQF